MDVLILGEFQRVGHKVVFHPWVHLYYIASLASDVNVVDDVTADVVWSRSDGERVRPIRMILIREINKFEHI